MSANGINLIPLEKRQSDKAKELKITKDYFKQFLFSFTLFLFMLSATIFSYYYVGFTRSVQKIADQDAQLKVLEPVATQVNSVFSRAFQVNKIVQERIYYSKLLAIFAKILPQNVTLDSVTVSQNKVNLNGKCTSTQELQKFQNAITDKDTGGEIFTHAQLNSTTTNPETQETTFAFTLTMKENVLLANKSKVQ